MKQEQIDFYQRHRKRLMAEAERMGLTDGYSERYVNKNENFFLAESFARCVTEAVMKSIDPEIEINQHSQSDRIDVDFLSGRTIQLETKCKWASGNTYPTADISFKKDDKVREEGGWLLVYYVGDRKWWIWDLSQTEGAEGYWRHCQTTMAESPQIGEYKRIYEFKDAIYEGCLDKGCSYSFKITH